MRRRGNDNKDDPQHNDIDQPREEEIKES